MGFHNKFRRRKSAFGMEEVRILEEFSEENRCVTEVRKAGKKIVSTYKRVNDIGHYDFIPNRSECFEESEDEKTGSVFISSIGSDRSKGNNGSGSYAIQDRNEGSDIRKNHGYDPDHKYSRVSVTAAKN